MPYFRASSFVPDVFLVFSFSTLVSFFDSYVVSVPYNWQFPVSLERTIMKFRIFLSIFLSYKILRHLLRFKAASFKPLTILWAVFFVFLWEKFPNPIFGGSQNVLRKSSLFFHWQPQFSSVLQIILLNFQLRLDPFLRQLNYWISTLHSTGRVHWLVLFISFTYPAIAYKISI